MNGRNLSKKLSMFTPRSASPKNHTVMKPESMPKIADLSDLISKLHLKWGKYQSTSRPAEALISIMNEYIAHAKPFFSISGGELMTRWSQFCGLMKNLELAVINDESVRPDSRGDIDLINARDDYYKKWQKDIADYQLKSSEHKNAVNILGSQIQDINEQISDVRAQQVLDGLRLLKSYQAVHQEIDEQLQKLETETLAQGCFNCFPSGSMKRLYAEIERLENKRKRFKTTVPDELRERLIDDLQSKIQVKRAEQEKLIQNPPQYNHENENDYHKIAARVETEKFENLCQISQHIMLDFVRLYILARDVYNRMPVSNLLTLGGSDSSAPNDHGAASLADLKPLFQQLVNDLNNNLADFYCMVPGRYDYKNYIDTYNQLMPDDKKSIIEQGASATLDTIKKMFPRFESEVKSNVTLRI